jgi:hypothetical protein
VTIVFIGHEKRSHSAFWPGRRYRRGSGRGGIILPADGKMKARGFSVAGASNAGLLEGITGHGAVLEMRCAVLAAGPTGVKIAAMPTGRDMV